MEFNQNRMKIGIFNEYMNTMGGGEKYMGAMAEFLSTKKDAEVDLITLKEFDIEKLSQKLDLDLRKCSTVYAKDRQEVEKLSSNYDLFINSSYQSTLKPKAKKNVLMVFFPVLAENRMVSRSKFLKKIIGFLNRRIANTGFDYGNGFHTPERTGRYSGRWTRQKFSLKLGRRFENNPLVITLKLAPISRLKVGKDFFKVVSENSKSEIMEANEREISFRYSGSSSVEMRLAEVFLPEEDQRDLGIFVRSVSVGPEGQSVAEKLKIRFLSVFNGLLERYRYYDFFDYYDLVLVISRYTQGWTKKIWGEESKILHPRVDVEQFFTSGPKEKKIISVGRFFQGGHSKKQLFLARVFKKMIDEGLGDWEYHLCGGTHPEKVHQQYVEKIKEESKNYPIHIHTDIPFEELKNLYGRSSIFWHASGFGEDENKDPDKFEHFGITTVEAMAAGCIPIVINKAGQKEIVDDGENGFLWNDAQDLKNKTLKVIKMGDEERNGIARNAVEKSKKFFREKFEKRMEKLFGPYITSNK